MRVVVVGTGYAGLVSGACFADFGHHVTCVDKDETKIASLQRGEIPIFEPDLDRVVQTNARAGRLVFTTDLSGPVLATKITFINEIADLAEKVGADVQEIARGIGLDNRIGSKFLHAGPGFGGSCFPKDTRALIKTAQDFDVPLRILEAVNSVNDTRKRAMVRKVAAPFGGNLRGKTVAVLGLTFKPNTDDMREAPSIPLITALRDMGATVRAFDPVGMEQARIEMPDIEYHENAYSCAEGADALVIVTEWEQFRALDLDRLKQDMAAPVVIDLRNIYTPDDLTSRGFLYQSVGRQAKAAG